METTLQFLRSLCRDGAQASAIEHRNPAILVLESITREAAEMRTCSSQHGFPAETVAHVPALGEGDARRKPKYTEKRRPPSRYATPKHNVIPNHRKYCSNAVPRHDASYVNDAARRPCVLPDVAADTMNITNVIDDAWSDETWPAYATNATWARFEYPRAARKCYMSIANFFYARSCNEHMHCIRVKSERICV